MVTEGATATGECFPYQAFHVVQTKWNTSRRDIREASERFELLNGSDLGRVELRWLA